ncbi:hypothetical protein K1F50_09010 [Muricauda oceani]|uniref:hypothetical protein n=1 Tax=Flagellimonas oceani TaxID=2698672 RepID=UPI00197C8823|nr:hypothetical protein [Allomuricauda oceani]MBW8242937.1 hypothetical protein [Allomuricauda oceani]
MKPSKRSLKVLFPFILTLITTGSTFAQEGNNNFPPPETPIVLSATRTEGKISIDGNLSEPDWDNAEVVSDFFRVEPAQRAGT